MGKKSKKKIKLTPTNQKNNLIKEGSLEAAKIGIPEIGLIIIQSKLPKIGQDLSMILYNKTLQLFLIDRFKVYCIINSESSSQAYLHLLETIQLIKDLTGIEDSEKVGIIASILNKLFYGLRDTPVIKIVNLNPKWTKYIVRKGKGGVTQTTLKQIRGEIITFDHTYHP